MISFPIQIPLVKGKGKLNILRRLQIDIKRSA